MAHVRHPFSLSTSACVFGGSVRLLARLGRYITYIQTSVLEVDGKGISFEIVWAKDIDVQVRGSTDAENGGEVIAVECITREDGLTGLLDSCFQELINALGSTKRDVVSVGSNTALKTRKGGEKGLGRY